DDRGVPLPARDGGAQPARGSRRRVERPLAPRAGARTPLVARRGGARAPDRVARRRGPLGGRPEIHLGSGPDREIVPFDGLRERRVAAGKAGATKETRKGSTSRAYRAWYYPLTLASGSDPRHESRVALLAGRLRAL